MSSQENYQRALERVDKYYLKCISKNNTGFRCVMVLGAQDSNNGITYFVSGASYTIYGDYNIFNWREVEEDFDFGKEISEEEYIATVREAIKIVEQDLKSIKEFDDSEWDDDDDNDDD